mmetsp:Transcript_11818/g.14314  ORF Transcript_11818/g.14314 Transcript_11818/m.14314 type:complete len:203 (-) Transcript_11818:246-854(-)|eukprot:CAMPEP_0195255204 /NCGR_PEP_ID=MMETSP0706-20130129/5507_1 /TAXON_ID=33640 /ORGANISM="Asterionellopsis glacialis, Strain CCMP134" /LENGTH=202 /DNA_ID=CAMNT_0040308023 /DNA_START=134 /DNA_END=742 /DNA_ORIENTATION=-
MSSSEDENDYESAEESVEEEEEEEESVEEEPVKKRKAKKFKDPNKPKRNMSAFFLFSQAMRAQVKEENPDIAFGQIAKELSVMYKQLTDKEKKKWDKAAEKDKMRYLEQMKDYVPPPEPAGGRKKKKKDPNAPKRNMSAFFLYSNHIRSEVKEDNPQAKFGDIAKLISVKYKALSDKERVKWDAKAAADKERYQREMAEYNA